MIGLANYRTHAGGQARGFSLIEVMIVVVIMGVVMGQMFMVLSSQRRTFLVNEQALNTQETARVVSDLISFDARMAGFMVPLFAGVSSEDGGPNNVDRFCVSDPSFALTPLDATPSPTLDNTAVKFPGAIGNVAGGTITNIPSLDVDGDGLNDFAPNGGIILSDGIQDTRAATRTFCDRIDTITGAPGNWQIGLTDTGGTGIPTPTATLVPAIIYEVGAVGAPATIATTLSRNGVPLSTAVEDLQVRYWVDSEVNPPDGLMAGNEWPIDDLNNGAAWMDLTQVRRIQISIVSVGTQGEQQEGIQFNRRRRPGVANHAVAAVFDDLPRRTFAVDVLPRNLLQ